MELMLFMELTFQIHAVVTSEQAVVFFASILCLLGFNKLKKLFKFILYRKSEKSCGSKNELAVQVGIESKG